jgi:hypothetical protein
VFLFGLSNGNGAMAFIRVFIRHGVRADERPIVRDQARMEAHYPQKFRKTLRFMSIKYCPKRLLTKQA